MINTALYNTDDSKALKAKGFPDIESAKVWMETNGVKNNYVQNARILVGYEAVEVYMELYELMKARVFGDIINENKEKVMI